MKHIGLIVFCAASLAMQNLAAITATKEYVDRRDEITREAAVAESVSAIEPIASNVTRCVVTKEYVEGLGITGGGNSGVKTLNGIDGDVKIGFDPGHSTVSYTPSSNQGEVIGTIVTRTLAPILEVNKDGSVYQLPFDKRIDYDVILPDSIMQPIKNYTAAAYLSSQDALAYATGVFNYMNANTNAWFSGTNYVVGVGAAARHKFAFEPGMDLASVPCSMALMELRDGVKQVVWDQRDWVSWYWSFKSAQMNAEIRATNALIRAEIASRAPAAWAQRTAATGLVNPDATTTWIDTQKIVLSPGMAWETVAEVEGCAYWTITGNATIGGDAAADGSGILTIKDFEGKPVMMIKKTESKLVYLERGDFVADSVRDAQGRVTFTMRSDVQPVGEYSTVLDLTTFVEETDEANPANYEWENLGDNRWRIHYLLKPTISASQCFARFKVQKQGSTTVEYGVAPTIKDGIIYNGVKIAPVIPSNVAVGDTITWKVLSK